MKEYIKPIIESEEEYEQHQMKEEEQGLGLKRSRQCHFSKIVVGIYTGNT